MNKYFENLKTEERLYLERFYGDIKKSRGQYFYFQKYIDDDNVIILTNDIGKVKDSYVLMTSKNTGVFLKDWQVRQVSNVNEGIKCHAVKLNRNFYKQYNFNKVIEGKITPKQAFDDCVSIAKEQDQANLPLKEGW